MGFKQRFGPCCSGSFFRSCWGTCPQQPASKSTKTSQQLVSCQTQTCTSCISCAACCVPLQQKHADQLHSVCVKQHHDDAIWRVRPTDESILYVLTCSNPPSIHVSKTPAVTLQVSNTTLHSTCCNSRPLPHAPCHVGMPPPVPSSPQGSALLPAHLHSPQTTCTDRTTRYLLSSTSVYTI